MRGYYPGERRPREHAAPPLPGSQPDARGPLRRPRRRSLLSKPERDSGGMRAGGMRARNRSDWLIGIALGIVLGVAIVAAFLYFGSEETIDAPSIKGVDSAQPTRQAPAVPGRE